LIISKVVLLNTFVFALLFSVEPLALRGASQTAKRIRSNIDESQTFALKGNIRPAVALGLAQDQGEVPGAQAMPRMSLHFTLTAAQRTDLDQLLAAQQNRRSLQYRKFLTPEQYANRFGLNTDDVEKVKLWLENNGFSNVQAARSRAWVSFSGTAGQAQAAFHTSIHKYVLNGEAHLANSNNPQLPRALETVVESVRGLHNFRMKPHFTSSTGTTYLTPDDWETIYDVKPLYSAGLDGSPISGQTYSIVVVGQSDVQLSDIDAFRAAAGLPVKDPTVLVPPSDTDPGTQTGGNNDEAESDLDLEWAGAIAKNANILFVTASSVENAIAYAIDNDVAPILSTSYGSCEPDLTAGEFTTQNSLFAQAAAVGMTVVAAAGNDGAADCDTGTVATQGLAVDFPASSQYVTGIGGTEFTASGSGAYFGSTNNSAGGSAVSYIPEIVWNDSNQAATGGGVSVLVPKPAWQTGTGVPNDGFRDVPDIAFTASKTQDGLLFCNAGSCTSGFLNSSSTPDVTAAGTSAGPPTFSGVLALLVQKTGTPVGLLNPNLYSLAAISTTVFHDITAGNNQVACQGGSTGCPATSSSQTGVIGYSAGIGYDQTTGWGSLDSYNFVEQWSGDIAISASAPSIALQPGTSGTATITVGPVKNFSGTVSFACSVSSPLASTVSCSIPSTTVNTSGSTTVTVTAASLAATPVSRLFRKLPPLNPAWLGLALAFAIAIYALRKRPFSYTRSAYTWTAAAFLVLTLGAVSCGSGSSSGANTLALACTFPQNAQVGIPYIASCTPSGASAPYTYSISVGTLPPGLSINTSSGAVTGTPTVAGGNLFTIQVASDNQTATEAIGLNVAAPSPQSGIVTVTATSGAIVNSVSIAVTVL
jgi:subtilase family serine protease